jgi:hypothetical protein
VVAVAGAIARERPALLGRDTARLRFAGSSPSSAAPIGLAVSGPTSPASVGFPSVEEAETSSALSSPSSRARAFRNAVPLSGLVKASAIFSEPGTCDTVTAPSSTACLIMASLVARYRLSSVSLSMFTPRTELSASISNGVGAFPCRPSSESIMRKPNPAFRAWVASTLSLPAELSASFRGVRVRHAKAPLLGPGAGSAFADPSPQLSFLVGTFAR